jgi:hypothetical protein
MATLGCATPSRDGVVKLKFHPCIRIIKPERGWLDPNHDNFAGNYLVQCDRILVVRDPMGFVIIIKLDMPCLGR